MSVRNGAAGGSDETGLLARGKRGRRPGERLDSPATGEASRETSAGAAHQEQKKAIGGSSHRGIPKTSINLATKLEILKKLDGGVSVPAIVAEYNVGRSTVYDVKYAKQKLLKFQLESSEELAVKRTRMEHSVKYRGIEEATIEWCERRRAAGAAVRGVDIQDAARRFARTSDVGDFNASTGWLYRFRRRHGVERAKASGGAPGADATGTCRRGVASGTRASRGDARPPGGRLPAGRSSVLFCANGDGSHRVAVAAVAQSERPAALRGCVASLSVVYHAPASAWRTTAALERWFHRDFVPAVVGFQEGHGVCVRDVGALLLLDGAFGRPADETLASVCGRVKVVFLPRDTTGPVRPTDPGTPEAAERRRERKRAESCLAIDERQEEEVTRAERTPLGFKGCDVTAAGSGPADSWSEFPGSDLASAWTKRLAEDLTREEIKLSYPNLEANGFMGCLNNVAGDDIPPEDEWLHLHGDDHGYQLHTDEQSAKQRDNPVPQEEDEGKEEVGGVERRLLLSDVRNAFDVICGWMGTSEGSRIIDGDFFARVKQLRCEVIKMQRSENTRRKNDDFLKRAGTPSEPSAATEPPPRTSAL